MCVKKLGKEKEKGDRTQSQSLNKDIFNRKMTIISNYRPIWRKLKMQLRTVAFEMTITI